MRIIWSLVFVFTFAIVAFMVTRHFGSSGGARRDPGEPPLYEAFKHFCIDTKVNYTAISALARAPDSNLRLEWGASSATNRRWEVGGRYTLLAAQTGRQSGAWQSYELCEVQTESVDTASLEKMRKWLGTPAALPRLGWVADFLWDGEARTPVSMEAAKAIEEKGGVVWHLNVSTSQFDKHARFQLSRPTTPGDN